MSFVGENVSEAYPGWRLFFDGAANHQGKGIGVVLASESGQHYPMEAKLRFNCTNNMAEYEACILELKEHPVHCSDVEAEPDGFPWRTLVLALLRCVDDVEAVKLIEQIHAGVCGTHMNGSTLARKILRAGYFWMTMENDCCKFVQKCHKCQVYGDLIRVPPHELNAMSSPCPFNNLICIFGGPESIITDNGANLNSHLMREICEQFKVTHRNSTAYHPQMNGVVEAANKNIKKILRKMVDKHRGWYDMVPYALLGYHTTVRTSIGATPYLLVYETEAVIPVEVKIPSLRIIEDAELSNTEWVSKRIYQLTLIDKKRMVFDFHGQFYRQRMIRAFHKRVRARNIEVGQLVIKHIFLHQDEYKGKFTPNWQGPYMVRKVLPGGNLVLSEMDGTVWPKPINSDVVNIYYV
nr:uncharacterized protein LOC112940959 [Solanum lycopersicum]